MRQPRLRQNERLEARAALAAIGSYGGEGGSGDGGGRARREVSDEDEDGMEMTDCSADNGRCVRPFVRHHGLADRPAGRSVGRSLALLRLAAEADESLHRLNAARACAVDSQLLHIIDATATVPAAGSR